MYWLETSSCDLRDMNNLPEPAKKRRRAGLIGREPEAVEQGRMFALFALAGESYAVPISLVQEIIKPKQITHIPHTPDFLRGVVNLRGKIVPVVDLRMKMGLGGGEMTRLSRIVIVRLGEQNIGMFVDSVAEVRRIEDGKIAPASPLISGPADSDMLEGVANIDEKIVSILDIGKALKESARS